MVIIDVIFADSFAGCLSPRGTPIWVHKASPKKQGKKSPNAPFSRTDCNSCTEPPLDPGREDFRRTLAGKMPSLLVGGGDAKSPAGEQGDIRAKLRAMNSENWAAIRDEILADFKASQSSEFVL